MDHNYGALFLATDTRNLEKVQRRATNDIKIVRRVNGILLEKKNDLEALTR